MVKVRDMLRVVVADDFMQYNAPELYGPQLVEVKEKIAMLKMMNDHGKIKGVGIRHNENIYYVELSKGDVNAG